jgi:hypothetical protein
MCLIVGLFVLFCEVRLLLDLLMADFFSRRSILVCGGKRVSLSSHKRNACSLLPLGLFLCWMLDATSVVSLKGLLSRRDRDRCVCVIHVSPVAVTGGPIRYHTATVLPNLGYTDINVRIFLYLSRSVPVFQCFTVIQRVQTS